jgi:anti-sigma factor RsiW
MPDERFTELLNLHLDHEASPAEAAEFEAEVSRDPARRRQYQAYTRMQDACAHLFERERLQAPASFALEKARLDAERKVAAPERITFRRPLVTAFASFAALAAGVAFMLTRLTPLPPSPAVATKTAPPAAVLAADVASVPSAHQSNPLATLVNYGPVPPTHDDYQSVSLVAPARLAPSGTGLVRAEFTGWTTPGELPPLQPVIVEDFAPEPHALAQPIMAISHNSDLQSPAAQTAAFQFRR